MDTQARALWVFLTAIILVFALPASAWGQLSGTPESVNRRQGIWASAGLGGGAGGEGGFGAVTSGNFAAGWTVNPRVLVGVGSTAVREPADRTMVTAGTLDARVQFYPDAYAGFFATAGLGLGWFRMDDSGSGPNVGGGIMAGLGYDFRVAQSLNITTYLNGFAFHTPDPRGHALAFGLGLAWH